MRVQIATLPASPDRPNEDFAAAVPGGLIVLDGAGIPARFATGCTHSVAWYARTLGGLLAATITDPAHTLAEHLAAAIEQIRGLHGPGCDLTNPHSPSATVTAARQIGDRLEYLVLADSTLLIQPRDGDPVAITDTRLDQLRARLKREQPAAERGRDFGPYRNQPGGFWVAGTNPDAAHHALTGHQPLADLASLTLMTDGTSRLVDLYQQMTWPQLLATLTSNGAGALLDRLRDIENSDPDGARWPRTKPHDDATVAHWPLASDTTH